MFNGVASGFTCGDMSIELIESSTVGNSGFEEEGAGTSGGKAATGGTSGGGFSAAAGTGVSP